MKATFIALILSVVLPGFTADSPKLPAGFKVTRFAGYPDISYPTGVAAGPTGEVYVCVDLNSSLDVEAHRGKIVRCVDTDGDGKADEFTDYVADIDSPRSSCFVDGTLYVVNPPFLTAFRDTDGDGVADEKRMLVKGMGFDLSFRGADHTSNGVRMGMDGWLYLAIGDYGFFKAVGTDGKTLHLHGGGVTRVRPDGSEIEHYSRYARNIYDVAVSPKLDVFARDNTNDGKGWNTRLHHFVAMADNGYPRLYKNFPNEHLQPLADYGGGSGTGAYWLDEPGFPAEFNNRLYTCDFTTSKVYVHPLEEQEATFSAGQSVFYDIKAIDMDCDGLSRIYVSDWTGGAYRYEKAEVGSVSRITYPGLKANQFPDLKAADVDALLENLKSASAVTRINVSRELLKRKTREVARGLQEVINDKSAPLSGRIAAIFTLKQKLGNRANKRLIKASADETIREWALRAATDHKGQLKGIDAGVVARFLQDSNPRVRLQAAISLARLGAAEATAEILKLAENPDAGFSDEKDLSKKYAANQAIPHTAVKAVVEMGAVTQCLKALDNKSLRAAALRALQQMHDLDAVNGLIERLSSASASETDYRIALLKTLFRLYQRDKAWDGKKWWTTRPDDRGPYFEPVTWEGSPAVKRAIEAGFDSIDEAYHSSLLYELRRNRIDPQDLAIEVKVDEVLAIIETIAPASTAIPLLQEAAVSGERDVHTRTAAFKTLGRIPGREAFKSQLAVLEDWRESDPNHAGYQAATREFVFDPLNAHRPKIVRDIIRKPKGYGGQITLMVALNLVDSPTGSPYLRSILAPIIQSKSGTVEFLNAVGELLLTKYLPEVEAALKSDKPAVATAAGPVAERLRKLSQLTAEEKQSVEKVGVESALKLALKISGDKTLGQQIFARQACLACHTVSQEGEQRGPYLGDAGSKWQRDYLLQSIIQPSAVVAQGFQTQWFETTAEFTYEGFVTGEADGVVELRNATGQIFRIQASDVVKRGTRKISMMPEGLVNNLSLFELASLLDYLQSLH
jgi:putative heme-binding domain-containing protein